ERADHRAGRLPPRAAAALARPRRRARGPAGRGHRLGRGPRVARAMPHGARALGRGHARGGAVLGRLRPGEDAPPPGPPPRAAARPPRLVVNFATTPEEAEDAAHRMKLFARHFLRLDVQVLGSVPYDAALVRSVRAQEPVLVAHPDSPASVAYRALAARLWKPAPQGPEADLLSENTFRLEA